MSVYKHSQDCRMSEVDWFNNQSVSDVYAFCSQSLCNHYKRVAQINGSSFPHWMAEKFLPDSTLFKLKDLFPKSREVILVRNFRDIYASIQSFIAKRGFQGFRREEFNDDRSYLLESFIPGVRQLYSHREENNESAILEKYEDLILEPQQTFLTVFDFLNFDASDGAIEKVLDRVAATNPSSQSKHQKNINVQATIGRIKSPWSRKRLI